MIFNEFSVATATFLVTSSNVVLKMGKLMLIPEFPLEKLSVKL